MKEKAHKKIIKITRSSFLALFAISLVAEMFFVHPHVIFGPEASPFFYALFGFGSGVILIVLVKILGLFIKRRPDYYQAQNGKGDE